MRTPEIHAERAADPTHYSEEAIIQDWGWEKSKLGKSLGFIAQKNVDMIYSYTQHRHVHYTHAVANLMWQ